MLNKPVLAGLSAAGACPNKVDEDGCLVLKIEPVVVEDDEPEPNRFLAASDGAAGLAAAPPKMFAPALAVSVAAVACCVLAPNIDLGCEAPKSPPKAGGCLNENGWFDRSGV